MKREIVSGGPFPIVSPIDILPSGQIEYDKIEHLLKSTSYSTPKSGSTCVSAAQFSIAQDKPRSEVHGIYPRLSHTVHDKFLWKSIGRGHSKKSGDRPGVRDVALEEEERAVIQVLD